MISSLSNIPRCKVHLIDLQGDCSVCAWAFEWLMVMYIGTAWGGARVGAGGGGGGRMAGAGA